MWITEKIHGSNWRAVYSSADDAIFVGSHHRWIKGIETLRPANRWQAFLQWIGWQKPVIRENNSVWWRAYRKYPEIEAFLRVNPDVAVFGEVYGDVQELKYGHKPGEVSLTVFNTYDRGYYSTAISAMLCVCAVPVIFAGGYSDATVRSHISGKSLIPGADHIREGIVIYGMRGQRLKAVSDAYLEKA